VHCGRSTALRGGDVLRVLPARVVRRAAGPAAGRGRPGLADPPGAGAGDRAGRADARPGHRVLARRRPGRARAAAGGEGRRPGRVVLPGALLRGSGAARLARAAGDVPPPPVVPAAAPPPAGPAVRTGPDRPPGDLEVPGPGGTDRPA